MRLLLFFTFFLFTLSPFVQGQNTTDILMQWESFVEEHLQIAVPQEKKLLRQAKKKLALEDNGPLLQTDLVQGVRRHYWENVFFENNRDQILLAQMANKREGSVSRLVGTPIPNPPLVQSCSLNIVVIVDQSLSIIGNANAIRNGLMAFVQNQIGTGNTVTFVGMGARSPQTGIVTNPAIQSATVTYSPGNTALHNNWINNVLSFSGSNDSWSTGFNQTIGLGADLVLMVTDGDDGNGPQEPALTCAAANTLKSNGANNNTGAHIFVYGQAGLLGYTSGSLQGAVNNAVDLNAMMAPNPPTMADVSTFDFVDVGANFGVLGTMLANIVPGLGTAEIVSIKEGICPEEDNDFVGTVTLCPNVTITSGVLQFKHAGQLVLTLPISLNANGDWNLTRSTANLLLAGLQGDTGYDLCAVLNTSNGFTITSPEFVFGLDNDFFTDTAPVPGEIISAPGCIREGEPFTVVVRIDEPFDEFDIENIYSFDNLYTYVSHEAFPAGNSQTGFYTEVFITFVTDNCTCTGNMLTFDIVIEGCSAPIWLMTDPLPCCTETCDFIDILDWDAGDCFMYNDQPARPFSIVVQSTTSIFNVYAASNFATCQTTLADLMVTSGPLSTYTITGNMIFDNAACDGHALISLILETKYKCCLIEQPFSFPGGCRLSETCMLPVEAELLTEGLLPVVSVSMPLPLGTQVTVTDNVYGWTSSLSIQTITCGPFLGGSGGQTTGGTPCNGLNLVVLSSFNCDEPSGQNNNYSFTITYLDCTWLITGNLCNLPTLGRVEEKAKGEDGQERHSTVSDWPSKAAPQSIKAYPNPFRQELIIEHQANTTGSINLTLYNVLGQQVYQQSQAVTPGRNTFTLVLDPALANGIYTIRISQEGEPDFIQQIVRNKDE